MAGRLPGHTSSSSFCISNRFAQRQPQMEGVAMMHSTVRTTRAAHPASNINMWCSIYLSTSSTSGVRLNTLTTSYLDSPRPEHICRVNKRNTT